jgi:hypothetical protein
VSTAAKLGVVALVALALFLLPGGGAAINVVLTLLLIAFLVSIAALGYSLFRRYRIEIESLPDGQRVVLYGSVGLAFLTFVATNRLFNEGGFGVLAWLALLGIASYGVVWVWMRYRSYE